jgi:hypothetical protein
MTENIKIYKFLFKAHITTFDLKANISSPLIINWKRSKYFKFNYKVIKLQPLNLYK